MKDKISKSKYSFQFHMSMSKEENFNFEKIKERKILKSDFIEIIKNLNEKFKGNVDENYNDFKTVQKFFVLNNMYTDNDDYITIKK